MRPSTFSNHPSIDLIIGPMYSGKSVELLRRLSIFSHMKLQVLYVNHLIDTRSDACFSSHSKSVCFPEEVDGVQVDSLESIVDLVPRYSIIGIDEAQFFSGLYDFCMDAVTKYGLKVIVAGLSGDFMRNPFGEILSLIPVCDELLKLYSYCTICMDKKSVVTPALFTKRITPEQHATVLVGGQSEYAAVCRSCYSFKE